MSNQQSISLQQAMKAQRALREAAGLGEERFPVPAFVGMISDEIELLRDAGHSDGQICDLISEASGITIDSTDMSHFYAPAD